MNKGINVTAASKKNGVNDFMDVQKKWALYPNSPSGKIVGKDIWFKIDGKFVKQEEEFETVDEVNDIIHDLQQANSDYDLELGRLDGEFDLPDGTRLKVTLPFRAQYPTIEFRRQQQSDQH